nr:hypothetical protein [Candidatus Tokpelaia sp.]
MVERNPFHHAQLFRHVQSEGVFFVGPSFVNAPMAQEYKGNDTQWPG